PRRGAGLSAARRTADSPGMPTLVQFGAGNIGRGFIAPVFTAGGWRVVFVDIDTERIAALHEHGAYTVHEVDNAGQRPVTVRPVDGILASDTAAVQDALVAADLVATAVGLGALRHLGANLAAGLTARLAADRGPLDILVCENGVQAPRLLHEAIAAHCEPELVTRHVALIRTSIGRMIPANTGGDLLDIRVEPYAHLPIEATAFKGPVPQGVPGLEPRDDFDLVLEQKLYLHNLTHAAIGYLGHLCGCATIPDCMELPAIVARARRASDEAIAGMAHTHGHDAASRAAITRECEQLRDDLFHRYTNRALADPVARICRDPFRKLAGDDRLVGAARVCLRQGITPLALIHVIRDACRYHPADDEPRAAEFRELAEQGWLAVLDATAQLDPKEPLMAATTLAERQAEAAAIIRKGGNHLRDDEVEAIEIADFGLDRYHEIGLAILVYVNTDRCCAKELAMTPGMVCPEHTHPPIAGELGKEETFRVRAGECFLFLPGDDSPEARQEALRHLPGDKRDTVTVFRCLHLRQGQQATLPPNTLHWFVAGPDGAVISEFSTASRDEADIFTDPAIQRVPTDGPHAG
ncbi:MAG: D-lyxose/D-mannose family sugar isomerase, partial [Planctomycetota bacterium]